MKILSFVEYYIAIAFYLIAHKAQKEVQKHEKYLIQLFGDSSPIIDSIYSPDSEGTKEEFDELLSKNGFTVDWQNKLKKDNEKKDMVENVSGS